MLYSLKTLLIITYVTALRYVHYPVEFVAAAFNRFTAVTLVALFWLIVARTSSLSIEPYQLVGYFLIVSGLSQLMLGNFGGGTSVLKRIRYGTLNSYLMRPMHPFFYLYYQQVGFMAPFLVISIGLIIAGSIISGGAETMNPVVVFITLLCAYSVNLALNLFVGCFGFYMVEAAGIKNTFSHITNLSQGFLIPIFLTPVWFQTYVFASPFAASLYNPIRALQGQPVEIWHLIVGIFWAITLLPFTLWLWRKSIRRYEGIGI